VQPEDATPRTPEPFSTRTGRGVRRMARASREALRWDMERHKICALPLEQRTEIRWRPTDDEKYHELYIPKRDDWQRIRTWYEPVLEGVLEGEDLSEIATRANREMEDRPDGEVWFLTHKLVKNLTRWDMIEIVTPEPPDRYDDRFRTIEELGERRDQRRLARRRHRERRRAGCHPTPVEPDGEVRQQAETSPSRGPDDGPPRPPMIVDPISTLEQDGIFHLAREFVESPSLKHKAPDGNLGPQARAKAIAEIVDLYRWIRDQGYVLVDVKTSNFMFDGPAGPLKSPTRACWSSTMATRRATSVPAYPGPAPSLRRSSSRRTSSTSAVSSSRSPASSGAWPPPPTPGREVTTTAISSSTNSTSMLSRRRTRRPPSAPSWRRRLGPTPTNACRTSTRSERGSTNSHD